MEACFDKWEEELTPSKQSESEDSISVDADKISLEK